MLNPKSGGRSLVDEAVEKSRKLLHIFPNPVSLIPGTHRLIDNVMDQFRPVRNEDGIAGAIVAGFKAVPSLLKGEFASAWQVFRDELGRTRKSTEQILEDTKELDHALEAARTPAEKFADELQKISDWRKDLGGRYPAEDFTRLSDQAKEKFLASDDLERFRRMDPAYGAQAHYFAEMRKVNRLDMADRFQGEAGQKEMSKIQDRLWEQFKNADPLTQTLRSAEGSGEKLVRDAQKWTDLWKETKITTEQWQGLVRQGGERAGLLFASPLDQLSRNSGQIEAMFNGGLLDRKLADMELGRAASQTLGLDKPFVPKFAGADAMGSAGAHATIAAQEQWERMDKSVKGEGQGDQVAEIMKQLKQSIDQQRQDWAELGKAIREGNMVRPAVLGK
jgi:hypothetical protein